MPQNTVHKGAVVSKPIFCAACQAVTNQECSADKNGEILCTCPCGRHLKFPVTSTAEELQKLLDDHQFHNTGQVTAEAAAADRADVDAKFKALMGISD